MEATAPVAKKAKAPVAKKAVVKKAALRKHSLRSLIGILRERKLREQALAAGSGSVLESGMIEDQVMPALPPLPSAAVTPHSNGYAHISAVEI